MKDPLFDDISNTLDQRTIEVCAKVAEASEVFYNSIGRCEPCCGPKIAKAIRALLKKGEKGHE